MIISACGLTEKLTGRSRFDSGLPLCSGGGGGCVACDDGAFGAAATTAALKLEYIGCMSRPVPFGRSMLVPAHWSRGTGLRPLIGMDLSKKQKNDHFCSWFFMLSFSFAYYFHFQSHQIFYPSWCIFSAVHDNFETIPIEIIWIRIR